MITMERISVNRHAMTELVWIADHGGAASIGYLYVKQLVDKGLVTTEYQYSNSPHSGICSEMTNLGWFVMLQYIGVDGFMLEELYAEFQHHSLRDTFKIWMSIYRAHKRRDKAESPVKGPHYGGKR